MLSTLRKALGLADGIEELTDGGDWLGIPLRFTAGEPVSIPAATRLHAVDASVTVVRNTVFVTDWARRYFGPWWNAYAVDAESIGTAPVVVADVNQPAYADLATLIEACPPPGGHLHQGPDPPRL
ncbi:hypothetical protein ACWY4P_46930 [Streptomyces sp. LZ34]